MKKLDYKLPGELDVILNSLEYEEDGGIGIRNVKLINNDLILTVHVFSGSIDLPVQIWNIQIVELEQHQITINWASDFKFYSDHFLLTGYHDDHAELYCNVKSCKVDEMFTDIYRQLIELGKSTTQIAKYVYSPQHLNILCKQGYGLFARGPKSIITIYEKALSKQGIKTNYISFKSETNKSKLLILGESYFIGQDFIFKRV